MNVLTKISDVIRTEIDVLLFDSC